MSSASPVVTQIVQAGAGTGKTEGLSRAIIEKACALEAQLGRVPRIVATTFTEKATAELRERVILKTPDDSPTWLFEFVQNSDSLFISTIHGVFSKILHQFGAMIDLDPDFSVPKSPDVVALMKRVLRQKMKADPQKWEPLFEHFSTAQLSSHFSHLVKKYRQNPEAFAKGPSWQELFRESYETVARNVETFLLTSWPEDPECQEFRKFLVQLPQLLRGEHPKQVFEGAKKFLENTPKPNVRKIKDPVFKQNWKQLEELLLDVTDVPYSPDFNEQYQNLTSLVANITQDVSKAFEEEKEKRGWLTFDDLELRVHELLEKHPEVVTRIQQAWDFWFVDEFQDTSPLQMSILTKFFQNPWNAYFVGDPQQSIYLFRGSDPHLFAATVREVRNRGGKVESLDTNYRSQPELVEFFNFAFSKLDPPPMTLLARGQPQGKPLSRIHFFDPKAGFDETDLLVRQIQDWFREGFNADDIGILVRTNDEGEKAAQKLAQFGIPTMNHSRGGFFNRREILDLKLFLKFLIDPYDDENTAALVRSPWVGISDTELFELRKIKQNGYWEAILQKYSQRPAVMVLAKAFQSMNQVDLVSILETTVDHLGLIELNRVRDPSGACEANILKFLTQFREASKQSGFSLSHFVRHMELDELAGEEKEAQPYVAPEKVNIMTIHKSKGLKFEAVAIPFCSKEFRFQHQEMEFDREGNWAFKMNYAPEDKMKGGLVFKELEKRRREHEEREYDRLFYVAVTRAAQRLALFASHSDKGWIGKVPVSRDPGVHEPYYETIFWETGPQLDEKKSVAKTFTSVVLQKSNRTREAWAFSVTGLTKHLTELNPKNSFKKPDLGNSLQRIRYGQGMHFIFETLKFDPDAPLEKLIQQGERRFPGFNFHDLTEKSMNVGLDLRTLVKNGEVEWPFTVKFHEDVIFGQIDMWGIVDDTLWIVDYKSGSSASAKLQLELYSWALKNCKVQASKVRCAVVYPLKGSSEIFEPRDPKELSALIASATTKAKREAGADK